MTKQDTFVGNLLAVLQSFDGEFKVKKMPKGYILTGIVSGDAKRIKVFFSGDIAQLNGLSFYDLGIMQIERLKEMIYVQDGFCPADGKECREDYTESNSCEKCILDWLCGAEPLANKKNESNSL